MRSLLFVPADSERKIEKALGSVADAIILDLEDSVATASKAEARAVARKTLAGRTGASPEIYVRINPLGSGFESDDIALINNTSPDGVMQPKTNSAADVAALRARLEHPLPIIAIATETAASVFNLGSYAEHIGDLGPMAGLTWGAEDLSNELGAASSRDQDGELTPPYQLARSLCLAGARAAGVEPIDTVCINFRNPEALERECIAAARDGFTAKLAIHPNQVELINRIFTPSPEDIAHATAVVDAFTAAGDPGVVGLDGKMYDRPHRERARKLLARAARYS